MKKRIAVLGNGWSVEYLKVVLSGIRQGAKEHNADVMFFMNYSINDDTYENSKGEANIFKLSEYADFDGVILLSNTFHLREEFEFVKSRYIGSNIPAISLEYDIPGLTFLGSENYSGMRSLCDHVLDEHDAKCVMYISGPIDHSENIVRRKALEDALEEHGLKLEEENVLVCNWNISEVERDLPKWLETHSYVPDYVACANDMMAMGACTVLENCGYHVPDDVVVTGFDQLATAEAFSPAIATVGRNWETLGHKAVDYLFEMMQGKEVAKVNHVETKAVPSESCGCTRHDVLEAEVIAERRICYNNYLSRANIGLYVCALADNISKAVTEEELVSLLATNSWNSTYEGEEFYICLVDDFFSSLKNDTGLKHIGYTDKMDVICGCKNGVVSERIQMDTKNIIPAYNQKDGECDIYLLLPLYGDEGCFGYVVFRGEIPILYDYSLYSWVRHMNMSMRHIRRGIVMNEMNSRLKHLSNTDALTGVYNRMGCDNVAYPFLEKCHRQGKRAALMFADINKMKLINDNFGHIQGDTAIRTIARVITEVLKDEWIVVRYGGDEFLMVGECENDEAAEGKLHEISLHLKEVREQMRLPYKLRVSMGYFMVNPEDTLNMSDCLTRAEDAMYVMKKKLHAEESETVVKSA